MVRIEFITYVSGGKAVRIKVPNRITLPITSKGYVPAELRVRPTKVSPLTKYQKKSGKKNRMSNPKCKCSDCSQLTENWIGDKCLRCYNNQVTQPVILKYDRILLNDGIAHLEEVTRLREVELENNRFWSSLVEQYRARLEVRMVDAVKGWAWKMVHALWAFVYTVRFFFSGGYRNLWAKK